MPRGLVRPQLDGDGPGRRLQDDLEGRQLLRRLGEERFGGRVAEADASDLDPFGGQPRRVHRRLGDLLQDLDAVPDTCKHRVLPVEPWLVDNGHEELRAGAVRPPRDQHGGHCPPRHLRRPGLRLDRVQPAGAVEAPLRRILRDRIPSLHHAESDHPVERRALVRAFLGQLHEVRDLRRRRLGEQVDDERAGGSFDDGLTGLRMQGRRTAHKAGTKNIATKARRHDARPKCSSS